MSTAVPAGGASDVAPDLADLETLDPPKLRSEWRRLFRQEAPNLSRDLIVRALAFRLQERRHGGLAKANLRRLDTLMRELKQDGEVTPEAPSRIRPGARLVREWRGRAYVVNVTGEGFKYEGAHYASLSVVARTITGAHWSGPRFFGLRSAAPDRAATADEVPRG